MSQMEMDKHIVLCVIYSQLILGICPEDKCIIMDSIADCSSLRLTSIPKDLPLNITKLELQNTQIKNISQGQLQRYQLLTHLTLRFNKVFDRIMPGAFENMSSLESLDLIGNNLSTFGN